MAVSSFFKKMGTKTRNFMNQAHSTVKKGVRFLNDSVLPTARRGHKFINDVNNSLQESDISDKAKTRMNNIASLTNVGIKHVESGGDVINRVHAAM